MLTARRLGRMRAEKKPFCLSGSSLVMYPCKCLNQKTSGGKGDAISNYSSAANVNWECQQCQLIVCDLQEH